jgi:transposase
MKRELLTKLERAFVEEARANTSDKLTYMKLSVLVLLDEGFGQQEISRLLGISLGTVNGCKSKYESDGLEKFLDRHYVPYAGKLDVEQLAQLDQELDQGLYSTCSAVCQWVEKQFGVLYTESGIRAILCKLGFVYKKTTVVPGGLNVAEQDVFLEVLEPFLEETDTQSEVVYFMDAVHPQHNTRADYVWARKGEQKEVPSNTGRQRLNINGAVNAHKPHEVHIVESERINAQSTQELLQKLLDANAEKEMIYVLADNARYYVNADLKAWLSKNPKLQLLHIPPYSPNLNLIERLWKFLRKKVINLHYYRKFEEFRAAILLFFQNIEQYKEELASLLTPNFQRFSIISKTRTSFS